jgi:hypothetical protein
MRRKKFIPIPEVKPETKEEGEIDEKLNTKELTLDEIEEIRLTIFFHGEFKRKFRYTVNI